MGNFAHGSGQQKAWWPNGNIKREINYQNNLKHGEERWFDENGKLEKVITFNEGAEIN